MQFLSSNEADWERRHPVTLLFFLIAHLYVLVYMNGSIWLLIGLVGLLVLERRFPLGLAVVLLAFVLISLAPLLIGWDVSFHRIIRQLVQLATFLFGMVWVSRFLKLDRFLPFLARWPRSTQLLFGAWALIPTMERAIRLSLKSHAPRDWQEAVVVGIDSQRQEPIYRVPLSRRFEQHDLVPLAVLTGCFGATYGGWPLLWLLYPYLTKGGMRDAMVIIRGYTRR
ncbi:hypothetical protein [Exiguobacterium sp. ZOR0005]|uniref:hypothetical protein n=1 Tax=Exiguobacterium sp. ZOR0005 TaxID=1339226 RepID=UPI00041BB65A|nr:hypothetical protein [Exiguobacterium sp. ZOR0005]